MTQQNQRAAFEAQIELPQRPEPDGWLQITVAGHVVDVNAYRDSTLEAYARP